MDRKGFIILLAGADEACEFYEYEWNRGGFISGFDQFSSDNQ